MSSILPPEGGTPNGGTLNGLPRSALSARGLFLLAAAIYLLTTGWNLGGQSISNPEEARYACAARQMLRDGDWIVPKFNGEARLVKPILFYWLIATAGKLGGMAGLGLVTAMRLVPVAMGFLTVCATFLLARKLTGGSSRAALVAAVVLITCNEFHKLSREIIIDMTVTAFLIWSWYFALTALDRLAAGRNAFFALLGFYLCLGLTCMSKGPLLVAGFMVLPFIVYLFMAGQVRLLARAGLWWGVPLSIVLGFGWFYVLYRRGHSDGMWVFLLEENRDRIVGDKDHIHTVPWLYYFTFLPEGLTLWLLAVPLLLWRTVSTHKKGSPWFPSNASKAVFCGLVVSFLIIGFSASKRKNYLLPLYPHFAIWAALVFHAEFESDNSYRILTRGSITRLKCVYAALSIAVAAAFVYEVFVMPMLEKRTNNPDFYAAVGRELKGRRLVTLNESANEAVWFLDLGTPIVKLNYPALKEKFFGANDTVLLLNETKLVKRAELKPAIRLIDGFAVKRGKDTYVLATPDPNRKPDEKLFEPEPKEKGKDKDSGED